MDRRILKRVEEKGGGKSKRRNGRLVRGRAVMGIGYTLPMKQLNGESRVCWNLNAAVEENDSVRAQFIRSRTRQTSFYRVQFDPIRGRGKRNGFSFDRTIVER